MEIREFIADIILIIIMVVSTLVLVLRLWQDLTIAVAATLMMLSLGGLFLSMSAKIRHLDSSVIARERTMRVNLEEISNMMSKKYENTVAHLDEIVQDLSRRMYR
ncbi:MAG: hypothetical protein LUO93_09850 [Methanomicrobiales archaeon]|nr:hypothetical protein [Methanomicrobiales archaeon]